MQRLGSLFLLALVVTSCATTPPPPIALISTKSDATALIGTWEGEYTSTQTQRFGSIRFLLSAQSDSAFGDVLMMTRRKPHFMPGRDVRVEAPELESQLLSIRFVMADRDSVHGLMNPYEDSDGSLLVTRFAGHLHGDRIQGQYFTRNLSTAEVTSGEWSVHRKTVP